jgi:hypothetical protein
LVEELEATSSHAHLHLCVDTAPQASSIHQHHFAASPMFNVSVADDFGDDGKSGDGQRAAAAASGDEGNSIDGELTRCGALS